MPSLSSLLAHFWEKEKKEKCLLIFLFYFLYWVRGEKSASLHLDRKGEKNYLLSCGHLQMDYIQKTILNFPHLGVA
jgi:hypothetical protein